MKTVFFDLDGVVIDSEKLHLRALELTLETNGISFDRSILDDFVGRSDRSFFQYVCEHLDNRIHIDDFLTEKDALFDNLLPEMQFVSGFPDFMRAVKDGGIQTALVTSSSALTVRKVDMLLRFTGSFDAIVTADDTTKHKPDPEPYLLALERTKAGKESTIIIEDSVYEIMAGKAAGCTVWGLTTSFGAGTLKNAGADFVFDTYRELAARFVVDR